MPEPDSKTASELLRRSLREGKQPYVTVASNSMLPLLRRGDRIRLGDVVVDKLKRGDIIAYGAPAELTVHRFWGIIGQDADASLLTKGDRHLHFDPPIPAAAIIGKVTARQRNGRHIVLTDGLGGWLNHRLANVTALEVRLLSIIPESIKPGSYLAVANRNDYGLVRRILTQLAHALLYYVSMALTVPAGALAQKTSSAQR